ncbi:MAG: hypothetical protein LBL61_06805, partial [Elusimicrobiota bacterium]|nr:hypothetical protein [Elusimicrobiota bacterium]
AIVLYFRKQKTEKVCRECGFTLIKDVFTKKDLMKIWQDINIFRDQPVSLTSRTVTTGIGETVSLNLPDIEAYMARVSYLWGSRRRGRNSKTGQALILEAKENLPYIKIAPKTNFFTGLKFFYKPAKDNMEEIKADRDYNLYCQQERAQTALDILAGVLPQIKKDKFVVEISGKWIVVVKWGYTTNFDKFVNKALPIAKAFDEKYL